jgi:UDP-2,3-diacylglucosamine hydrolase
MRKVFIADAHLKEPHDENYRTLLRFLATLPGNTDTLFILGDLFEFLIGYPLPVFPQYAPIIEQLLNLTRNGVRIIYFEGNHDFHLGSLFTEELRAEVHRGPAVMNLDGKTVYLCHGDQVNRLDHGYRLLRAILHSALAKRLIPLVPASLVAAIAAFMSRNSSRKHGERQRRWDYAGLLREFAAARFREGCDVVISGHFHLPFAKRSASDGKELVSLGDWISQFSYAEWRDGEITLKTFR